MRPMSAFGLALQNSSVGEDVIEMFPPRHLDRDRTTKAFEHLVDRLAAGNIEAAFVDDDLVWDFFRRKLVSKEPDCCGTTLSLGQ